VPYLHGKGPPDAPVWVIVDRPYESDINKGYLFSGGIGYVFDKMLADAGITNYHVTARRPDTDNIQSFANIEGKLNQYKPPIIIPLGAVGKWFLPEMNPKHRKTKYSEDEDSELSKYAGSLCTSPMLTYPHYCIPSLPPDDIIRQWKQRDIVVSIDLSRAYSELEYWRTHEHNLRQLPLREHKIHWDSFDELLFDIDGMLHSPIVSNDIETIYPRAPTKTQPSQFYKILPGYPVTLGLADSVHRGISFDFFRESTVETRELWKHLQKLFWEVPQLGQNFFNFDACFFEMLGFRLPLGRCKDTMIRHHILWPELKHTLQFQTRQYTREVYYKDEGHGWSGKDMRKLKIYNVKDVCCTLEIYNEQEKELMERGLL
jgi:hypothetical protein